MEFIIIYAVLLTVSVGVYVSFIRTKARCPEGTCATSNLKTIALKGLAICPLIVFYIVAKMIVLLSKFNSKTIEWTDF